MKNGQCSLDQIPGISLAIHQNGAGKTTLMKILFGLYRPDEGEILVKGERFEILSPAMSVARGISMVHQHFKLIERHTVAENISLGFATHQLYPTREVEKKIDEFSKRYGLLVNPKAYIWQLSAGERQRVEIIKALYQDPDILILDEPTSVLTPGEVQELFSTLQLMKKEGKGIIFVTHKLDEVMAISDRVTVLRRGKVVNTLNCLETNKQELAKMMVGREVLFSLQKEPVEQGKVVVEIQNIRVFDDMGILAVKDIDLIVHEGETVGIAGVAGNGQREFVEAITGLRKVSSGRILLMEKDVTNRSPRFITELGVAHIPEERIRLGLSPNLSVEENLILKTYYIAPYSDGIFLNTSYISSVTKDLMAEYDIMAPSPSIPAKQLSGGNIQRLILARELSGEPRVIIAAHPTYGLDVGATEYVRKRLLEERKRGAAILLISEDLEEILALSDRVAVIFEGTIMGIVAVEEANIDEIGLMMAGTKKVEDERI